MRRPSSRGSESNALTAISSQVEIRPLKLACWSPREVRNRKPFPSPSIHLRTEKGSPSSAEQVHGADVGGQHCAHGERGLRVGGVDDGLGDGALHGLCERAELGLQQVIHQHAVAGLAALPEHGGAVGEELARSSDPEGVGGILLPWDQGRRHGVEVAGGAGLRERATSGGRGRPEG